ncbi:ROK family protein [Arenibacter sp. TNZ]|nr:ROK family protein [Arenibacter sp. TNZ]
MILVMRSYHYFQLICVNLMTMEKEVVLGIDLGGTYTKLGLVTKTGSILNVRRFDTKAKFSFHDFLKKLEGEVNALKSVLGSGQQLIGIGIGAPNANPQSGNMENPPNFRWGQTVPLVKSIKKIFNLPVALTNDANAAALGELEYGLGKGMKNFVVLT